MTRRSRGRDEQRDAAPAKGAPKRQVRSPTVSQSPVTRRLPSSGPSTSIVATMFPGSEA
jgi:hypothetical protein